jgi:hypothetical protein
MPIQPGETAELGDGETFTLHAEWQLRLARQ